MTALSAGQRDFGNLALQTFGADICTLNYVDIGALCYTSIRNVRFSLIRIAMAGKRANQVDMAIGQRIRLFRKDAQLSGAELAKRIGVSLEQVRKYESGTDRVGVGRLMQIAAALDVTPTDFFRGLTARAWNRQQAVRFSRIMTAPHADAVLRAFSHISNSAIESAIVEVVQTLRKKLRRRKK